MRRLIWGFAGRTYHIVGNPMPRLTCIWWVWVPTTCFCGEISAKVIWFWIVNLSYLELWLVFGKLMRLSEFYLECKEHLFSLSNIFRIEFKLSTMKKCYSYQLILVSINWEKDGLAPVLKTIFHRCVISYTCSQSNSDGSVLAVLKQSHQS